MRYIPTSDARVEHLKKQAKKLQRSRGGKHVDLLDRVAKQAGYDHWHHVTQCVAESALVSRMANIRSECETLVEQEIRGSAKIVVTGRELRTGPFVIFSTGIGDAWLLEPNEQMALCLVWQGSRQPIGIDDTPTSLGIEFDGTYALLGEFFRVDTQHPDIGVRAIAGYPMDALRTVIDQQQSADATARAVFAQPDALGLTPALIEQLVSRGWDRDSLGRAAQDGFRYLPARDSLVSPMNAGGF